MMKTITIVLSFFIVVAGVATPKLAYSENQDVTYCIQEVKEERGNRCGDPKSAYVQIKNNCRQRAYVHFCLQKTDGTYDCRATALDPSERSDHYVCQGTGQLIMGACTVNGDCYCDNQGNCYIR
ncbi:MAG: hypothetical protein ACE5I9_08175 [Candidatus Methylomirabilales bacterium]